MMLIFTVLLCMNVRAAVVHTFELTPADATQSDWLDEDSWIWDIPDAVGYKDFDFEAGQSREFAVDLSKITGKTADNKDVTMSEFYEVKVELNSANELSGLFQCADSADNQPNPTCSTSYKCQPSLGVHKFTIKSDEARKIGIRISADSISDQCAFDKAGDDLKEAGDNLVQTILIVFGVLIGLCVLTACLVFFGCCSICYCCMKNQQTKMQPNNGGGSTSI